MSAGRGVLLALAAAALFGLVGVLAKGSALHPLWQGGLAYLLAGLLLAPFLRGARIAREDWPRVLAMGLAGGALAPALLFYGLRETTALNASLLLTLEMVFTALLAFLFLRERAKGRHALALLLLLASALLAALAGSTQEGRSTLLGVLLVTGAALAWGVDNALSARLVGTYDPNHLLGVKGLAGGGALLLLALALRTPLALSPQDAARVLLIGALGIGGSVLLFYHALRHVGAARASATFLPASALVGAVAAALVLREPFGLLHLGALALLVGGILLLASPAAPPEASGTTA